MTYSPMYSRQRADFVAATEAEVQPLVDAAEAARDAAIAAPLEPTIAAYQQAIDSGVTSLSSATDYIAGSVVLDFVNGYFRAGTATGSTGCGWLASCAA